MKLGHYHGECPYLVQRLHQQFTLFHMISIVPQLSKCLKFEAVWGVSTDRMILI